MRSHSFRTPFDPGFDESSICRRMNTIAAVRGLLAPTLALIVLCYAFPARAAETTPVKCGVNEDRVWVYDSLTSFDVGMKLKCGEPVEVIGREKGYVKIRTSSGKEGYVPEKALPKPPETEANSQNSADAQASTQAAPQSLAAAARARTAAVSTPAAAPKLVEHASITVEQPKPIPTSPASVSVANDPPSSAAPAIGSTGETNSSTAAASASSPEQPKPQPLPARSQPKPVTYSPAHSPTKSSDSANSDAKTASASQGKPKPASSSTATASTKTAAVKASSGKTASVSNVSVTAPMSAASDPDKIELASNLPSSPPVSTGTVRPAASPRDPDEDEEPVMKTLENREACKTYFSAYGLSPNQYKWMTRNRSKSFPGICPAPAPDMVDFIVIFTHDADFYNGTMPTPVHTDKNGFSDFTPLTTVDTTVVSPSDADKNRREYVWVFHTKRGTFDPSKFSPKRRPLFSTTESNKLGTAAGSRSAEDALRFIDQHGVDR
ncbi:MAG TPA: SH3 domain-containing protein [Candidatus Sulfotelmatobacter sp.]|nr:SH3 domain-containing protein [Candidatus Sulfotelmatobacter sp.]